MKVKSYYEEQINQMYDDYDLYMAEHYEDIEKYIDEMAEEYEKERLEEKTDKLMSKIFGV